MSKEIQYPHLPEGKTISYVPASNPYMALAKAHARTHSLDEAMPGAAAVIKDGALLGIGANGSDYHKQRKCQRVILGCKSGQGYELCEGCHPKNHSEAKAIQDAMKRGNDTNNADLYLWGHWWCCKPCWEVMVGAGIKNVFLLEGSEMLFNKEHPNNIVGKQFSMQ